MMRKQICVAGILVLVAGASLWSFPNPEEKGLIHQAYVKIKEQRQEYVNEYADSLFELADDCANAGHSDLVEAILSQVLALYEPPQNRIKISSGAGVMVRGFDKEKQKQLIRKILGIKAPEPDPELIARQNEAKKRAQQVRSRLASDPSEETSGREHKEKNLARRRQKITDKFVAKQKKLALKCVEQGYPAHAYELLLWTLQVDPENEDLREKLLRQKQYKKRWYTHYELEKAKKGYRLDPDYGWVTANELKAIQAGKLRFGKKWLPKDQVEALRRDWKNHWEHDTEHFRIMTNASLSDAVEFGREVERLYSFFFRVFVDFYAKPGRKPDPSLVFGGGMDLRGRKLILHYYRSRESYLEELSDDPSYRNDPLLAQSAGFYDPNTTRAYFYREQDGPDLTTIYHEVTHQIFGETYPDGPRPPVWMVEGLAVFMEDPMVRGTEGLERFLAGAEPPLGLNPKTPLDINDFMATTQDDEGFHHTEGRGTHYQTAGAVVHFFLLHRGGFYRRGFIQYCQEAYKNGEVNKPVHIDQLYEYLKVGPDKLQADWLAFNQSPDLFDF